MSQQPSPKSTQNNKSPKEENKEEPDPICSICKERITTWTSGPLFNAICCKESWMHLMCALAIKQCGDCGTKLDPALEQALKVAFDKHCKQWTLFENSEEQQRLKTIWSQVMGGNMINFMAGFTLTVSSFFNGSMDLCMNDTTK